MAAMPPYRMGHLKSYAPPRIQQFPAEYFSGCDISIFFGTQFIDEITSLSFQLTERVLPVYGYASYTARTIVRGTRIVQGTFTTNARAGDYLHEFLYRDVSQSLANIPSAGLLTPPQDPGPQPDPVANPAAYQKWVDAMTAKYWTAPQGQSQQESDLSRVPYFIAPPFTILILYGDIDHTDFSRSKENIRTIQNANIYQVSQGIDLTPNPIGETWGFIATDINAPNRNIDGFTQGL